MAALTKRMLIDATHSEEMRVAIVDQTLKLEHLDIVHAGREPLKGNIYLARVRRIEPSLQAAFVEYDDDGEKRHGFLSFAEIHPDYFRIPVADRDALRAALAKVEEKAAAAAERGERLELHEIGAEAPAIDGFTPIDLHGDLHDAETEGEHAFQDFGDPFQPISLKDMPLSGSFAPDTADLLPHGHASFAPDTVSSEDDHGRDGELPDGTVIDGALADSAAEDGRVPEHASGDYEAAGAGSEPHAQSDDDLEEQRRRVRRQFLRNYRIQEVIKRGQVMLIQVVKEERGSKGAALTTYLSLAGRYCVLMPNSDRAGGVSRKISNPGDRRRLKETLDRLNMPDSMSVILRTAGVERSADEIKRDYDYLTRLWEQIRQAAFQAVAPALIYEEANLIKRAIRDHFARDVDAIVVQGTGAYKAATDFIRLLMPTHESRVIEYTNDNGGAIPLFTRYQIEPQIEKLYEPTVQLKSGGYLVINPTEALISIDVNSGRATRDRHIEETALRTNLEAAEEVARQLKLRDFAGLVVIDFIDMEDGKHNQQVERKLKEAMRGDRARLQIGRISGFGLMEMSRQRLRASLLETNFEKCGHCAGTGHVRCADSAALSVLRGIEDEGLRGRAAELAADVPRAVALYLLGEKREAMDSLCARYGFKVYLRSDESLLPHEYKLEVLQRREGATGDQRQGRQQDARRIFTDSAAELGIAPLTAEDLSEPVADISEDDSESRSDKRERGDRGDRGDRNERGRNRRTRGRTRSRDGEGDETSEADKDLTADDATVDSDEQGSDDGEREAGASARRRSRRGGQRGGQRGGRNRRGPLGSTVDGADSADAQPEGQATSGDKAAGDRDGGNRQRHGQRGSERSGRSRDEAGQVPARQPSFNEMTVLEIDTTPRTRRKPEGSSGTGGETADKTTPKVGWWRRWTGGL